MTSGVLCLQRILINGLGRKDDVISLLSSIPQMNVVVAKADYAALQKILDDFAKGYHEANQEAVKELGRGGWEGTWNNLTRICSQELLQTNSDPFAVRQKLEAVVDAYRRAICNPVQLFASMYVQDTISQHIAALERWCDENKLEPITDDIPDTRLSPIWQVMRCNARFFRGWTPGCNSFNTLRLPWNLYSNPHSSTDMVMPVPTWCAQSRQTTLFCSIAETARIMETSPPQGCT